MSKMQHHGRIGDWVAVQLDAGKAAQRLAVVKRILDRFVSQLIPDSPDGLGRQDRRPRKRWRNCQFLLSPVGSVGIRLLDPA